MLLARVYGHWFDALGGHRHDRRRRSPAMVLLVAPVSRAPLSNASPPDPMCLSISVNAVVLGVQRRSPPILGATPDRECRGFALARSLPLSKRNLASPRERGPATP